MTKDKAMLALDVAASEHISLLLRTYCINSVSQSSFDRASEAFSNGIGQLRRCHDRASKIIDAAFSE